MMFIVTLMCTLLLCSSTLAVIKCTPPFRRGLSYTFDYFIRTASIAPSHGVQWQMKPTTSSEFLVMQTCTIGMTECAPGSDHPALQTGAYIIQVNGVTQRSNFTIYNVSTALDKYQVRLALAPTLNGTCEVEVYDFMSTPLCDWPRIENKGNSLFPDIQLTLICSIYNVFPEPKCEFLGIENEQTPENAVRPNSRSSGYYDSLCKLSIPLTDLEPKLYQFQVLMYPNVTNGTDYGKTANSPVDLSLPQPICLKPYFTGSYVNVECRIMDTAFTGFACNYQKKTGDSAYAAAHLQSLGQSRSLGCSGGLRVLCDSQCVLNVSVHELGAGIHRFKVSMTKDGYSRESDATDAIELRAPEVPVPDANRELKTYSLDHGADLMIEIGILGQPPPNEYSLTRRVGSRRKRFADGQKVEPNRFKATYSQIDEVHGFVTLVVYSVTDRDIGQYELNIQNGVGDGLRYGFNMNIDGAGGNDGSTSTVFIIGGIVAVVVVLIIVIAVVLVFRHKDRSKTNEPDGQHANDNPGFNEPREPTGNPQIPAGIPRDNMAGIHGPKTTDVPRNKPHYPVVHNDYLSPLPAQGIRGHVHDHNELDSGYDRVIVDHDIPAAGYAKNSTDHLRRTESPAKPENIYDSIRESDYRTPGTPYELIPSSMGAPPSDTSGYMNMQ